jgi:DNA-binding MurR/RpiR family transcriptional regulator
LYFWITKWDEELRLRKSTRAIQVRKRLKRIKRSVRMLVSDKILELSELLPSYTHTDIANELGVSRATVTRALK